jgi:hypothetical protein
MMQTFGMIIGWSLVAFAIIAILATIIDIHKNLGILSTRGFYWLLAVIVGSLFGVVLYRFFRPQVEDFCETMFKRF